MNKKVRITATMALASLVISVNCMPIFAATPVPSKSNGNTPPQTSTEAPAATASTTNKATAAPASTQKATSKPKATEKATSKPKTTQAAKSSAEPSPTNGASETPEASPSASPTNGVTTGNDQLVFSEETGGNVVSTTDDTAVSDKKGYTTKGGSFGWFILSVIVNAIISFIIGNRFYKMGRRDTHILAEIRALKKDIDSKMQYNIGGFSEYETVIENSNKNYEIDENSPISDEEKKPEELATEIYRKWENQVIAAKERETMRQNSERRSASTSKNRGRTAQRKINSGLSGKVKGFINDVFPFDKD